MEASRLTVRAGLAAVEGRQSDALGDYREALRLWRDVGLLWDALCGLDFAILMGMRDDEARATAERTREILTQLGARPFLPRLEAVLGAEAPRVATAHDGSKEPALGSMQEGLGTALTAAELCRRHLPPLADRRARPRGLMGQAPIG